MTCVCGPQKGFVSQKRLVRGETRSSTRKYNKWTSKALLLLTDEGDLVLEAEADANPDLLQIAPTLLSLRSCGFLSQMNRFSSSSPPFSIS